MKLIPKAEAIQICSERNIPIGAIHPEEARAMTEETSWLRLCATRSETMSDLTFGKRERTEEFIEHHEAALNLAEGA